MTVWRRILTLTSRILFYAAIGLLALAALFLIFNNLFGNGQSTVGSFRFARVATGSMEPQLPTGSFILIERVEPSTLAVGDTITFWSDDPTVPSGIPVSHRLERIEVRDGETVYITKGVANTIEDPYPVSEDAILGRVVWHSVVIGAVIGFAQSAYGFPILIGVLLLCLIFNTVTVVKEAKHVSDRSNEAAVAAVREETLRELQEADNAAETPQHTSE